MPFKRIALCLPGILLTIAALLKRPANFDDFRAFYRGAGLVSSAPGVYSGPGKTLDTFLPFLRLPSYAWMLHPLHSLTYGSAHALWICILVLAFAGLLRMVREQRDELALAICCSYSAAWSLVLGQDIALVMLIAAAVVRLYAANREIAAGLVASLLAIKVTFLFPAALVFLARSRQGFRGLVAGTATQLALSFAVAGRHWPLDYLAILRNPLLDPEPRRMVSLRALLAWFPHANTLFAIAAALVIGWLWFIVRRLSFDDAMKVALPLGLIASAHCYIYDAAVLIPLFVSVGSLRTWMGRLALFGLTPLPYLLVGGDTPQLAFVGSALIVTAVLFATVELYRTRGVVSENWWIRPAPGSAAQVSPAM